MGTAKKNTQAENTTLLVLVVDRSGSMESIRDDMEGGIKTLLDEQAEEKGACLVTLAQFDDTYELVVEGVPVAELEPYRLVPRGSTALLDAIGRTIGHVKGRLDGLGRSTTPGPCPLRRHHRRYGECQQGVEQDAGHGFGEGPHL